MMTLPSYYYRLAALLIGIAVAYFVVSFAVQSRLQSLSTVAGEEFAQSEAAAQALVTVISRLGADQVADTIVSNCPAADLAKYNNLLGRLNDGLSQSELQDLDRNFGRCGYRNYQRRSILVLQLDHLVSAMLISHRQLVSLHANKISTEEIALWQDLLEAEYTLTQQFRRLTELQDQIIQALLLGGTITSPEIEEILLEVKQVRDAMTVRNLQLETLRDQLSVL